MLKIVRTTLFILFAASLVPPVFFLVNRVLSHGQPDITEFGLNLFYSLGPTITITTGCTLLISFLNNVLPWRGRAKTRLLTELGSILLFAFAVAYLFTIAHPEVNRDSNFTRLLGTNVFFNIVITLFIVTIVEASFFFKEWQKSRVEGERLQKEHYRAQFQNLRNQVNPHLLFNSLNTLTSLIETDQQKAVGYVQNLSRYLRKVLTHSTIEAVPLEDELSLLRHYYQLQSERFGSSLQVEINIPPEMAPMLIPPLTLQMLVENGIKHNIISKRYPLKIKISTRGNFIEVYNRKATKLSSEDSTGVGLKNIAERYQLLSGREIIIEDHADYFKVTIPLLKLEE